MGRLARAELESLLRTRKLDGTLTSARPLVHSSGWADQTVGTGIEALDRRHGGGVPRGELSSLSGPPSSGRTSLLCGLLLPENPNTSAEIIRTGLEAASGVNIGVLVVDSQWQSLAGMGTVGVAIGLSVMPALIDLRGLPDIFGYKLQVTQVGAADELAAATSLVMGQVAEEMPVVHVRGFPYPLRDGNFRELIRPRDSDLFR